MLAKKPLLKPNLRKSVSLRKKLNLHKSKQKRRPQLMPSSRKRELLLRKPLLRPNWRRKELPLRRPKLRRNFFMSKMR